MTDDRVVVLVILRPASGRRITGDSTITSTTLGDYEPSPDDATSVVGAFAAAGFDVGPLVGISFSATAPRDLVEKFFGTKVVSSKTDGVFTVTTSGERSRELPLGAIPSDVADRVEAAVFETPEEVTC